LNRINLKGVVVVVASWLPACPADRLGLAQAWLMTSCWVPRRGGSSIAILGSASRRFRNSSAGLCPCLTWNAFSRKRFRMRRLSERLHQVKRPHVALVGHAFPAGGQATHPPGVFQLCPRPLAGAGLTCPNGLRAQGGQRCELLHRRARHIGQCARLISNVTGGAASRCLPWRFEALQSSPPPIAMTGGG